jgi:dolichol-phosphate mannosyltransferase
MPQLMVVLPTYNEIENLPRIIPPLMEIPNLSVLVVDDNSPDGTGAKAEALGVEYGGRISVLHRKEKNGLGPAYIAGFKQAISRGADYILQMDADGSHQPKYIPDMVRVLESGADMVLGSRFVKGGSVDENWSYYRKLLSWWANRIYTPLILGLPVYDATGGFRLWRRETLIGIDLDRITSSGYVFQVEMAYVTHRLGYKIVETPIHFPDRTIGESKMDARIPLEAALGVWKMLGRYNGLKPTARRTQAYTV